MGLFTAWRRKAEPEPQGMPPLLAGMGVVDLISLDRFCSDDETREHLTRPFTVGPFTYATNGHIIVRVARRADVSRLGDDAPPTLSANAQKLFDGIDGRTFAPMPAFDTIPEKPGVERDCSDCEGKGCGACEDTGTIEEGYHTATARFHTHDFALEYVDLIRSLPNVMVAFGSESAVGITPTAACAMAFLFDGGCGVVMPLRRDEENGTEESR